MYCYEGISAKETMTPIVEQVSITTNSHPTIVESHSDAKLHMDVEHQLDNVELQNKGVHSDLEVEQTLEEERRIEPRLSKYVRRNHPEEQIIGEKDARLMTRRSSRKSICLVSTLEPEIVSDALENEDWISAIKKKLRKLKKIKLSLQCPDQKTRM